MKTVVIAVAIIALNLPLATFAQANAATPAATAGALTEGEVRKVDMDAKKITIKHGPIINLDMPPMTMVFQVQDPALLTQVKAGDKIRFAADKVGSAYTVTRIKPVK
jgi:Cu/Ag efflux protein CusF